MPKQKTIPELKAEIAANERQLAQLRHKRQHLETVPPTTKKVTAGNGHTGLSPVGQLWRAWPRWQRP